MDSKKFFVSLKSSNKRIHSLQTKFHYSISSEFDKRILEKTLILCQFFKNFFKNVLKSLLIKNDIKSKQKKIFLFFLMNNYEFSLKKIY